jgi:tetratricopeptide (TPR) repeat protein
MESVPPLASDPARQAVPTLRGYAYQIWRTLLAWMNLAPDEVLFIEGAEDFDVLRADGGVTVQVKDLSRPVTLANADVLDAILHYWGHRARNPERPPHFRFLTTADRRLERERPFGDERGLDVWDRCRRPGADLGRLRDFLRGREWTSRRHEGAGRDGSTISAELSDFLANSDDEALREQLIRPIHWDTGSDLQPTVETLVDEAAIALGYRLRVPPSDSARAVDRLLRAVWEVACRPAERSLRHVDLLRVFEEAVSQRVSLAELQHLRFTQTQALAAALHGDDAGFTPSAPDLLASVVPYAGSLVIPRTRVVTQAQEVIGGDGVLVLSGSTGAGKSVLARLIALRDAQEWRLLDLRGLEPGVVRDRLRQAMTWSRGVGGTGSLIIDDVDLSHSVATYENALAAVIDGVRSGGGRVVITTHGILPEAVVFRTNLRPGYAFPVPPLDTDEIAELARLNGCSDELAPHWAGLLLAFTAGHPQLAHAKIRALQMQGWPKPSLDRARLDEDVSEVHRQARQRLRDQLPDTNAHTLAYRLSVFITPFRRQHALRIAEIPWPGDAFDRLVGPWVEPVDEQYFRVSPLLSNVAAEIFPPDQIADLHRAAANSLLDVQPITPVEFGGALFHGLLGADRQVLSSLVSAATRIKDEHMVLVAAHAPWFTAMRLRNGGRLFDPDPVLSLLLRRLQFAVAIGAHSPETALEIAAVWDDELESAPVEELAPGPRFALRMLFFGATLVAMEVPFPIAQAVRWTSEALRLLEEEEDLWASAEFRELPDPQPGNLFVASTVHRCRGSADVEAFLSVLSALPGDQSSRILAVFDADPDLPGQLLAKPVLASVPADAAAVERIAQAAVDLGTDRSAPALVAAAYRARALVETDDRSDFDAAWRILDEGEQVIGGPHLLLLEYRARVMYAARRYGEAVELWDSAFAQWGSGGGFLRAFACRDASAAAGHAGQWTKAAELAETGEGLLRSVGALGMAVGLRSDRAYALWKAGDTVGAIQTFAEALDQLSALPSPDVDLRSYAVHKFIGHQILWALKHESDGDYAESDVGGEPVPGEASSPRISEEIRSLPLAPVELTWSILADLEAACRVDAGIARRARSYVEGSRTPIVQAHGAWQVLSVSLRSGRVDNLVDEVIGIVGRTRRLQRLVSDAGTDAGIVEQEPSLEPHAEDAPGEGQVLLVLGMGLLAVEATEGLAAAPLERWRSALGQAGVADELFGQWSRLADPGLATESEAFSVLTDSGEFVLRLAAAVRIAACSRDPDRCFYAHVTLFTSIFELPRAGWIGDLELHLETVVVRGWTRLVAENRFALRSPAATAPSIQTACEDAVSGMVKAARVLLAARNAVGVRIPDSVLGQLRTVADRR